MLSPPEKSHAIKDGAILSELEVDQPSQAISCFAGVNKSPLTPVDTESSSKGL